jgi:hypothetical protein
MHLSSVLVGIVIGVVLGSCLGWLAGRGRGRRDSDDRQAPLYQGRVTAPEPTSAPPAPTPGPDLPPAWSEAPPGTFEPESIPEPEPVVPSTLVVPGSEGHRPQPGETDKEEALIAELRAVNLRLTREAQTRLSRPSGDGSSEAPAEASPEVRPAAEAPETPGQDLLERSRRLAEDARQRLSRDPGSEGA